MYISAIYAEKNKSNWFKTETINRALHEMPTEASTFANGCDSWCLYFERFSDSGGHRTANASTSVENTEWEQVNKTDYRDIS